MWIYSICFTFYPSDLSTYSSRHRTAYIIKSCVYVGEQKVLTEQTFWLSLPLSLSIPKQEFKCLFFSIVSVCLSNECRRHIWCLKQLYRRVVLCELHLVNHIAEVLPLSLGEAVKEFGKMTLERHCNVRPQALQLVKLCCFFPPVFSYISVGLWVCVRRCQDLSQASSSTELTIIDYFTPLKE